MGQVSRRYTLSENRKLKKKSAKADHVDDGGQFSYAAGGGAMDGAGRLIKHVLSASKLSGAGAAGSATAF